MLKQFGFILQQQIKQNKFKIDIRLVNETNKLKNPKVDLVMFLICRKMYSKYVFKVGVSFVNEISM